MSEQQLAIGLLGLGTVGSGVVKILQQNGRQIEQRAGAGLQLKKILVRDTHKPRRAGVDAALLTADPQAVLADREIRIVVELIGGIEPARTFIETALNNGKYVVTANKDLMATRGPQLMQLAAERGVNIYYEASVGGGIPLIRPLKQCLAANRILRLMAIINGTTNYILTKMARENLDFTVALKEAQSCGFAEADPSSDLEGRDAAYKLAIMAALAFHSRVAMDDISVEGITGVQQQDILYARELGYAIKLLAIGERLPEGLSLRVHPTLVPLTHPLAGVLYENNAVFVEGDAVGQVMFYGPGAGSLPTGSAVVADIIEAARNICRHTGPNVMETAFTRQPVLSPGQRVSRFYLRLQAKDQPGVFACLATAFAEQQVSLDMIIQKGSAEGTAEIVLITHDVAEERFSRALERIKKSVAIRQVNSVFRVAGQ